MTTLAAMAAPEYGAGYIRWRVNRSLRNIGLFVVAGGALASWAARRRLAAATALPDDGFVLELDLERQGVAEHVSGRGLRALLSPGTPKPLQLSAVCEALLAAGDDPRVKGLLALLGAQPAGGLAQVQELRSAVAEFRWAGQALAQAHSGGLAGLLGWSAAPASCTASTPGAACDTWSRGHLSQHLVVLNPCPSNFRRRAGDRAPTVAYADAFGERGSGGTAAFYLASAFDHIFLQVGGRRRRACFSHSQLGYSGRQLQVHLFGTELWPANPPLLPSLLPQPTGLVSVTGLAAQGIYARGFLERWSIKPAFFAREVRWCGWGGLSQQWQSLMVSMSLPAAAACKLDNRVTVLCPHRSTRMRPPSCSTARPVARSARRWWPSCPACPARWCAASLRGAASARNRCAPWGRSCGGEEDGR